MSGLSPRIDTLESQVAVAGVTYVGNASGESGTTGYTVYSERKTFTVTIASPGVVTLNAHGYSNGDAVVLSTTGALPTGLAVNTVYYVVSAGTNTFSLASSLGGTAINTSGTQSGVHTVGPLVPHVGTGGVASATFAVSNINPLRGLQSFVLSKDAANRGGEGVSYNLTIDRADLARVLTVSFEYQVLSGTLADGDLRVYLIQDPNGTPVIIQPAGYTVLGATAGVKMKHSATFQTDFTAREYRLCIHVGSASTSAYSVGLDSIAVGPQKVLAGVPITDWVSYTPTFTGLGTVSSLNAKWRRVGDSINVAFTVGAGTTTASLASMSLPFAIDTTKAINNSIVGQATAAQAPFPVSIMIGTSSPSVVFLVSEAAGNYFNATPGNTWASLTTFGGEFSYPAAGLSSNTVMSQDTDTRVVAARITKNSAQAGVAANTQIIFDNPTKDTHAAWDVAGSYYQVPVSGWYDITANAYASGATAGAGLFAWSIDSGATKYYFGGTALTADRLSATTTAYFLAGQQIKIYWAGATVTINSGDTNTSVSFVMRSGPATIAASETVALTRSSSVARAIPTFGAPNFYTAYLDFDYSAGLPDTHGAWRVGVGYNSTTGAWVTSPGFVVPVSGIYSVDFRVLLGSTAGFKQFFWHKNGSAFASTADDNTYPTNFSLSMHGQIRCNAGDILQVLAICQNGQNVPSSISSFWSGIEIFRVGN